MRFVLLALAFGGCTVCDRLQSGTADYNHKKQGCPDQKQTTFDRTKCDKESANCSQNDVQKVDQFIACAAKLPVCAEETKLSFGVQSVACLSDLVGVSLGCLSAISLQ
jgi:hypothetical protein